MKISSSAFKNSELIPQKYSCDGDNINPPLEITEIPESVKSLILIMDDPDIPSFVKESKGIDVFDHWVVFNIKPDTEDSTSFTVEEGVEPKGSRGVNSTGKTGYMGPCPPDGSHRYFFKIYALNSALDLPESASKAQVEKAMDGLVTDSAELMGHYDRK
ncbi:MAG: YbhB/YbcL family Raf kinase inhibitor-like protein [Patescibacteria group bacterium]